MGIHSDRNLFEIFSYHMQNDGYSGGAPSQGNMFMSLGILGAIIACALGLVFASQANAGTAETAETAPAADNNGSPGLLLGIVAAMGAGAAAWALRNRTAAPAAPAP